MRVAIYTRVSTRDKGQDTENQAVQLRRYAEANHWEVVEYSDHDTGKHANREAFKRMFDDASRRQFGVVLVWALDRLTREGVYETFNHIKKLQNYGILFESYTEAHFRTTGPAGELMLAIAAWIAKQERLRISERTKAGMERAKAQGRIAGRRVKVFNRQKAWTLRQNGTPWRRIADIFHVSHETARKAVKAFQPRV